jgi:hypothetical protein
MDQQRSPAYDNDIAQSAHDRIGKVSLIEKEAASAA